MPARTPRRSEPPPGLRYEPELVSSDEERALVARFDGLEFKAVVMRGYEAKRTTLHFGFDYGYDSWRVSETEPIPDYLLELRERAAERAKVEARDFVEALLTRYPAGAGIGWHRDAPPFGDTVLGVSFNAACTLRFRRPDASPIERYDLLVEPRSLYVISGEARTKWQHSIDATPELRYSVTFRALRKK